MERNIEELWNKYNGLLGRLSDHGINKLLKEQSQRIAECTFNTKSSESFTGPGGLLEFSLNVAQSARNLNDSLNLSCSVKSILLTSLLTDIGRIGDLEEDTFIYQDSDWHRDKLKQLYKWNENCSKMSMTHRTLFLLQHYGVKLTKEEWLTIQLSSGMHNEENRFYLGENKGLIFLIQTARQHVINTSS
tara:strand:+ start:8880 stop:9446 length:567 start_codon:yes stop_codon:yes gene_type:complete